MKRYNFKGLNGENSWGSIGVWEDKNGKYVLYEDVIVEIEKLKKENEELYNKIEELEHQLDRIAWGEN